MKYVKHFDIDGVETRQVACIELHGKPNAATEACLGALGIDVDSPTHDVYKCVAVSGSVYTWELLSSGMSMISSTISGYGAETMQFPYDKLLTPTMYVIKVGDLIFDSKGYVYQVISLNSSYCDARYSGIQVAAYCPSGVYVGSDSPPNGVEVWVNPNGESGETEEWKFTLEDGSTVTRKQLVFEEQMMVLRLKDKNGKWVELPALAAKPFTYEDFTPEQLIKLKGEEGKSAYAYAQDGGYKGSESDFAKTLANIDYRLVDSRITRNAKEIANIKAGLPDDTFYEDSAVAYIKDVPANALPCAEVLEVGGMTYKEGNTLRSAPVTAVESVGVPPTDGEGNPSLYTLTIPAEVQALEGYGDGVDETYFNRINLGGQKYTQCVKRIVFDGTEDWKLRTTTTSSGKNHFAVKIGDYGFVGANRCLCNRYNYAPVTLSATSDGVYALNSNGYDSALINLRDSNFSTIAEYKAQLATWYAEGNPLTVLVVVADPIITDISDLLPADNLIPVEGGGTIRMVNEHGYDVPSTVVYQLEYEVSA